MFFSLLNIYVSWYIYCYTDKTNFTIFSQLLACANVLKHCSYMVLVSWATFFFFSQVLKSNYSAKFVFVFFFFSFKYLCKLVYIYCYTDTTNFTIFSQLLRYQFLISQNKIIKYEMWPITTENKCFMKMLWHLLGESVNV